MKSKKPFLIVCSVALTLAVALPFMGVLSFAVDTSSDLYFDSMSFPWLLKYRSLGDLDWLSYEFSSAGTLSLSTNIVLELKGQKYQSGYGYVDCQLRLDSSSGSLLSSDSSNPTRLEYPYPTIFRSSISTSDTYTYYVLLVLPPDPLAPVSDGMDTMISVFGDVIDYIINTPDVAIFVAISVASCAIIPMGIILIKKLIKGY